MVVCRVQVVEKVSVAVREVPHRLEDPLPESILQKIRPPRGSNERKGLLGLGGTGVGFVRTLEDFATGSR